MGRKKVLLRLEKNVVGKSLSADRRRPFAPRELYRGCGIEEEEKDFAREKGRDMEARGSNV
jgi:hypothetical protein